MELQDCALPLLAGTVLTDDVAKAFAGVHYAILVGSMPRKDGMERSDLLRANVGIFKTQGQAIDAHADRNVKVLVVGNPAKYACVLCFLRILFNFARGSTNCAVAAHYAPSIPRANFSALTRLDHNRAVALVARHLDVPVADVHDVCIWGNHSSTQYPDVSHARAAGRAVLTPATESFFRGVFVSTVQKRGAAVLAARKLSSAASAAQAIVDHVRDWHGGTGARIVSMAVASGAYGVPEGVIFSYPVRVDSRGHVHVVQGLQVDAFSRAMLDKTYAELLDEWTLAKTFV